MRMSLTHWGVAAATAAIVVAALLLGVGWYHRAAVQAPLVKAASGIPGLARTKLAPGDPTGLTIALKPGADVAQVYPAVEAAARTVAGHPVGITVTDNASAPERALWANLRFVVATGTSTGQYVAMQRALTADARTAHIALTLAMGSAHLYLTLSDGHGHCLIRVVALPKGGAARA